MKKLTLNKEQMIENLHLAMEEIILQSMILNRRGIVQVHLILHGHVGSADVQVMPANTQYREGVERPEPLGVLDARLDFYDWMDVGDARKEYAERMAKMEPLIRYLDHLIARNKPIEVDIKEVRA